MPGLLEEPLDPKEEEEKTTTAAPLPKGVVLGKDGKPCRTCTSSSAWMSMMKSSTKSPPTQTSTSIATSTINQSHSQSQPQSDPPTDCPPDVEQLGRSSWTLLHALTASYPPIPSDSHQHKTATFLSLFAQLYPCWHCASDFQSYISRPENAVADAVKSQEDFGRWMCRAHNEVNRKLGKEEFNCDLWKERWRDGWGDGRCG